MKRVLVMLMVAGLVTAAQATVIDSSFTNLDFDESTSENFPDGFDSSTGYDVPGWQDMTITDAGIENAAWWTTYDQYSAFLKHTNGTYNLSTYEIQAGDVFTVGFWAKTWDNVDFAELTATLFYGADPAANAIGSFTATSLPYGTSFDTYVYYESDPIAATAGSVGQLLGISMVNTATEWAFANFDEVTVDVVPEPATMALLGFGALAMIRKRK